MHSVRCFEKNVSFSSKRLRFRGISAYDAETIVKWRSQKDIFKVSKNPAPITMESHLSWFDGYMNRPNEIRVIITDIDSDKGIGVVGGICVAQTCILSYYIAEEEYRGKGLAVEALKRFVLFVYMTTGLYMFEAHIKPGNIASVKTARNAGFLQISRDEELMIYALRFPGYFI